MTDFSIIGQNKHSESINRVENIAGNGGCIASSPSKPERFFGVSLTVTERHRVAALRSLRVCRISSGRNLPKHVVLGGASGRGPLFPSKHFEGILCLESGERRPACPPGGLERRPGGEHAGYTAATSTVVGLRTRAKSGRRGEGERARIQEGIPTPTCRRRKPVALLRRRPR